MDKVRQIRNNLNLQGDMRDAFFVGTWKQEASKDIAAFCTEETPVVFTNWTTVLINE